MRILKLLTIFSLATFSTQEDINVTLQPTTLPSPIPSSIPSSCPTMFPTKYWDECKIILPTDEYVIVDFFEEVMESVLSPFPHNITVYTNEVVGYDIGKSVAEFCKDTILLELSLGILTLRTFSDGYPDLTTEEKIIYVSIINNFLANSTIIVETRLHTGTHTTTKTQHHTHMDYVLAMSVFIFLFVIVSGLFLRRKCKEYKQKRNQRYEMVKTMPIIKE